MINVELTVNEVNAILLALAKQPYESVAQLIEKIREQAIPQVPDDEAVSAKKNKLKKDLANAVANEDDAPVH